MKLLADIHTQAIVLAGALSLAAGCAAGEPNRFVTEFFSEDYETARSRFRADAERSGAQLTVLDLAAEGPDGEPLTIDIAWFGTESPRRVLLHSSGLHGVEAFAGSAIQLQWLRQGIAPPEDTAVVLVHVINPYGMAWLRRFNENSVDLNRNFLAESEPYSGAPARYAELDSFLNPSRAPSSFSYYLQAGWLILRHGLPALKQAVARGQYENPQGLFYGGSSLEQGPRLLTRFVADRFGEVEKLVVVDVHTGLGPFGEDTLLVHAADEGSSLYRTMQESFGPRVASLDPDASVAYRISGAYDAMYPRALPETNVYFVCQEFGTYNSVEVLRALRAENHWHHHGDGVLEHPTKAELKEAFMPGDESWRNQVLSRGKFVIEQALRLAQAR